MKSLVGLLFITICFFYPMSDEWTLVKDRSEIRVYVRKLKTDGIKEVKIVGKIKCSLSEFVSSLEDVKSHTKWVSRTIDSRILEMENPKEIIYYLSTDMPFPIQDRDIVILYKRHQDPSTGIVYTESTCKAEFIPLIKNFIRIPDFYSTYTISPLEDGFLNIEYFMKIDPGGLLPVWLINLAVTTGPIETMESLFDLIHSGAYSFSQIEGITEMK